MATTQGQFQRIDLTFKTFWEQIPTDGTDVGSHKVCTTSNNIEIDFGVNIYFFQKFRYDLSILKNFNFVAFYETKKEVVNNLVVAKKF